MWTGVAGTVLVHGGAIVALVVAAAGPPQISPPMYAVQLVAAPTPTGARRPVAETPPPPAPAPAPPKATAKPTVAKPKPATTVAKPTTAPRTASPVTPLPGETPGTGSDIANVNLQGKQFPFPEYLANVVTQIYKRWSRPMGNASLQAEVGFVILRDGTVKDVKMISSSRSMSFDNEALAAIEVAAAVKAFGPLPAGYNADYLSIGFTFSPRRAP